eukprot:CAMPEP_0181226954 /NCGR_PEP_ID=MMETSP1096-20121128/32530_1 /TAXON_ID=156174 ORGANISM="Chrysochromulina ericina, Strain CCMP281" /NCGR_SAMPLE_ID=MMETSP1096 /ASSEMBLY_ACC=CAM_ASM_000453 /LENGTH=91 /DNA_ID=CAMNT_0023320327 /DNA_START=596 /DNA_END=871 /DNA_ORIENTATION=+
MFAKECSAMNLREALSQAFWPILAKWVVNREGSEKSSSSKLAIYCAPTACAPALRFSPIEVPCGTWITSPARRFAVNAWSGGAVIILEDAV